MFAKAKCAETELAETVWSVPILSRSAGQADLDFGTASKPAVWSVSKSYRFQLLAPCQSSVP